MLTIIIVTWNVRDLLRRCLQCVQAGLDAAPFTYELVVVDNGSHDGTVAMVRSEFPQVHLLTPGANLGFAAGNNLALRQLLARPAATQPRYVLLLNPDTEPQGDALVQLVAALEQHPTWVAVGPQLIYGDGQHQPSRRRWPTAATFFWESTSLERCWPRNPWARRYRCADLPADQVQLVDWLVGAALLVRVAALPQAGLLDERFFMYSEELEWQARLQAAWGHGQGAIAYLPTALVLHYEGRSSEQASAARLINFHRSKLLLARMWHGWHFERLLRAYFWAGFGYELASEWFKLKLGHRPQLRQQRIAAYRQVLQALREQREFCRDAEVFTTETQRTQSSEAHDT
ncbi:glycosyltransferase family 2 protein [Candidatus Viridilinea mediisalina]|uniref:Glycosyl transferase n=1 Tax=Candidatus Viridilinea mediisalina TaxID=2024553 RepID=A0A2A6RNR4_9CHLR|nr:glycosyltransferase family 2 protein [Candidatus Viridilinea mediisalina]PDW04702.1 glycosyl transferase [Candidatus Viridilinea mediisalina]